MANGSAIGFCNVTFPISLLKGSYSVVADENQPLPFEEQTNESHVVLSFNFPQNVSSVRIEGTEDIPEFPWWAPMLVALGMLTALLTLQNKKAPHKKSKPRRESQ
jgi:hypothetical protein